MTRIPKGLAVTVSLWCLLAQWPVAGALAQKKDDTAESRVLKQMEAVGKTFRSFEAHISKKLFTAVLKEFDTPETGDFYYSRAKDGTALIRQEINSPGPSVLTIKGGVATFYQPRLKQAQMYNLGKNKDKAEYLVLGLGQTPGKLRETFLIQYQGTETVAGTPCSVLVLKPKNPSAAALFSVITLWIKQANGVPIQQKLQQPNGDYLLVNFTDEKLNVNIPASKFEQKLPSGVDIQKIG